MYDDFMEHVPYRKWADYLISRARELTGKTPAVVLDAACGTGPVTSLLFRKLPESLIYGFDLSGAMLKEFTDRMRKDRILTGPDKESPKKHFRCSSDDCRLRITAADIRGPVPLSEKSADWIISTHDALNYMLTDEDFQSALLEMHRLLKKGGLFSFDMVTYENITVNFHKRTFSHTREGIRLLWTNSYDKETALLQSVLQFTDSETGETSEEIHIQKYRSPEEVRLAAEKAGFMVLLSEGDYRKRNLKKTDILMNFHCIKE